ncbi:MAG: PD-(D/E)XK nuclease family protein [Deferribacteraceae bacterium]|jgi:hypothetical protein|nr:PD-(D/E)XK nuclease family protein [Deferribacteraceae bacterium]
MVRNFLENVNTIFCYQNKMLAHVKAKLAPEFSLFDHINYGELTISSIIRGLLDPNGTHGQGNLFLCEFLKLLDLDYADVKPSIIRCEWSIGNGRIDIFIVTDKYCIAIENKLWAKDQKGQVKDYLEYIKNYNKDKKPLLIYLTIEEGREPDKDSIEPNLLETEKCSKNVRIEDYYNFITSWLKQCIAHIEAENVRWYIKEIINFIYKDFYKELFMYDNKEIQTIIMKTDNAIELIEQLNVGKKNITREVCIYFVEQIHRQLEEKMKELSTKWNIGVNKDSLGCKWKEIIWLENEQEYVGIDFDTHNYKNCYFFRQEHNKKPYDYYWCDCFRNWSDSNNLQKLIDYKNEKSKELDNVIIEICDNIINLATKCEEKSIK